MTHDGKDLSSEISKCIQAIPTTKKSTVLQNMGLAECYTGIHKSEAWMKAA
jgi:hypothetical protein